MATSTRLQGRPVRDRASCSHDPCKCLAKTGTTRTLMIGRLRVYPEAREKVGRRVCTWSGFFVVLLLLLVGVDLRSTTQAEPTENPCVDYPYEQNVR